MVTMKYPFMLTKSAGYARSGLSLCDTSAPEGHGLSLCETSAPEGHGFSRAKNDTAIPGFSH